MKRIVLILLLLFPSSTAVAFQTQLQSQELIFAHMAIGGGWESELTLVAQGDDTSAGVISFYGQDGLPMQVTVDGSQTVSSLSYFLIYRSSKTYRLTGSSSTKAGWISVSQVVAGNQNHGSITGQVTFRYLENGVVKSQVGVLPSKATPAIHLPFDNTGVNLSAIAYTSIGKNTIQATLYRENGAYLETKKITLEALNQQALFINQLFPNSQGTRGFLIFIGDAPFNCVALNVNNGNWSSAAAMPASLDRVLQISLADKTRWKLHLVRDGSLFYGVAEREEPFPTVYLPAFGSIIESGGQKLFLLNLHGLDSSGIGINLNLSARMSNDRFFSISGKVASIREDGTLATTGTFELYVLSMAQYAPSPQKR